jgi:HK97 family phage prohead protease
MKKIDEKKLTANAFCYKSFAMEVKEIDKTSRIIKGYLASFNTKDAVDDILLQGCFAKSISEHGPESKSPQKILHLWQHDSKSPLGQYKVLAEDETGLYFEAELDPIPKADEVIVQYESGTLNQHSIGFYYIWDKMKYSDEINAFMIGEVALIEGSTVTFGCNPNTPFLGFGKSLESDNEILKQLEAEMNINLAGLPYAKQVDLRKTFAKYQSLANFKPIDKDSLKTKHEPTKISINHLFN